MRFVIVSSLIVLLLAPTSARAYAVRSGAGGHTTRWAEGRIELRVDPAIDAHLVARAADAWAEAPTAPAIVVAGRTMAAPGFRFDAPNENGVYLVRGRWDHGAALAVTITTSDEASGAILDSDVLVSDRDDLVADAPSTGYDLESVVTHELGHLLGLGESADPAATMYARTPRGSREARTLDADDRAGIAALYPTLPPTLEAYGCTTAEGSSGGAALVVLAAILALRGARRPARVTAGPVLALLAVLSGVGPAHARAGEVISTEVEDRGGLYVTIARVVTADGEERVIEIPGGTRDGVVQCVGRHVPPRPGDSVVLTR